MKIPKELRPPIIRFLREMTAHCTNQYRFPLSDSEAKAVEQLMGQDYVDESSISGGLAHRITMLDVVEALLKVSRHENTIGD